MWVYGLDWAGPGQRQVADACECGNEHSGSVKCGEFLDQLQTGQLLKKDSAPRSKLVSTGGSFTQLQSSRGKFTTSSCSDVKKAWNYTTTPHVGLRLHSVYQNTRIFTLSGTCQVFPFYCRMASCGFRELSACSSSNALSCSHVLGSSKSHRLRESSSFVNSVWS